MRVVHLGAGDVPAGSYLQDYDRLSASALLWKSHRIRVCFRAALCGLQVSSIFTPVLQQSYPRLPCFQPVAALPTTTAANASHSSRIGASLAQHIDLQALSRVVAPNIHKYSTSLSLSKLVASVLGKPLDKSQQISNWEQRPLSVQQQVYAAGDALVLTVVFDVLWHNWLVAGGDDGLLDRLAASSAVKHLPVAPSDQVELAVVGAAEAQQLL